MKRSSTGRVLRGTPQLPKTKFFSGVGRLLPKYMKAVVMNVDEVIKKYVSEQRGTYRLLSEKTKEFLSSILISKGIVPHSITNREKDPEKLREKITIEGAAPDALFNGIIKSLCNSCAAFTIGI